MHPCLFAKTTARASAKSKVFYGLHPELRQFGLTLFLADTAALLLLLLTQIRMRFPRLVTLFAPVFFQPARQLAADSPWRIPALRCANHAVMAQLHCPAGPRIDAAPYCVTMLARDTVLVLLLLEHHDAALLAEAKAFSTRAR